MCRIEIDDRAFEWNGIDDATAQFALQLGKAFHVDVPWMPVSRARACDETIDDHIHGSFAKDLHATHVDVADELYEISMARGTEVAFEHTAHAAHDQLSRDGERDAVAGVAHLAGPLAIAPPERRE